MLLEPACVIDAEVTQQLLVSHCLVGVQTAQCNEDPLCTAWPGICLRRRNAGRCCSCLHSNALLVSTVLDTIPCQMLCGSKTLQGLQAATHCHSDTAYCLG